MKNMTQIEKLRAQQEKLDAQETELKNKLKDKRKKIKARIQLMEAVEKKAERKKDTRRKILIGAMVLERIEQERGFEVDGMEQLKHELNKFLSKPYDRELFELDPTLPEIEKNEEKQ